MFQEHCHDLRSIDKSLHPEPKTTLCSPPHNQPNFMLIQLKVETAVHTPAHKLCPNSI